MEVIIDEKSGFCFGVKNAIELAEEEAQQHKSIYCLGEIVHNSEEVKRLESKGIRFIDRETFFTLSDCKVLFRAHGEPPETYDYARKNKIEVIDATCPVVLKLQQKVQRVEQANPNTQIVIYGRANHPEVVGLKGQVQQPIIVESLDEINKLDFSRPVHLFAQTTKNRAQYAAIREEIEKQLKPHGQELTAVDSICGQVANRAPWLAEFSKTVDVLIFVGGKTSSNSKMLFTICKEHNPSSFFITHPDELNDLSLPLANRIGITGATSTPQWLIEQVAEKLRK